MASAIVHLGKLQVGIEATKGTLVPATVVIPCKWTVEELQDRYYSGFARGQRAPVGKGLGTTTVKGVSVGVETELTAEDILWPLSTGVRGTITPTNATPMFTWLWSPQITTGIPTIETLTAEMIESDGTTNHYYGESGYMMTESIGISYKENAPASLKWRMFGRSRTSDTPTAALEEYSTREPLVGGLLSVYLDDLWANLGVTQLLGTVRAADWELSTGYKPKYTADGRTALDFTGYTVGELKSTLKMTFELDAIGAARIAAWRALTAQFVRLKYEGNAIGAGVKTVRIDGAYRFPAGSKVDITDGDNGIKIVSVNLESYADATSGKTLEITAINGLATL